MTLFPDIATHLPHLEQLAAALPEDRIAALDSLSEAMRAKTGSAEPLSLVFICTHNSRRSHLAQIWAQALAAHLQLPLRAFSGGTEATAFNPNAVNAMKGLGFEVEEAVSGVNPRYQVRFSLEHPPMELWSKHFSDSANPASGFIAVMTCGEADEACPFVPGAAFRISLPYEDPKKSDGSGREPEVYRERSLQIASELLYAFGKAGAAENPA